MSGAWTEACLCRSHSRGRAWDVATWDATQGQGPEEPWGECRLASAGTWRGKAAARRGQTSPPFPTGLFPEASETAPG